ncbi:ribonuclease H-like domain-containing protein [Tanacetum coccineum]
MNVSGGSRDLLELIKRARDLKDDWSIEFDAEHMHFGQDGLDDFDWSNKADDAPVSLALMATNSEVPYCSKCRFGIESSNSMESDISSGDETLTDSTYENFKREKAYKAVPPPTGTIIPPRANVSFTGIDELAIRNKVVNQKNKHSKSAIDRNKGNPEEDLNDYAIIEVDAWKLMTGDKDKLYDFKEFKDKECLILSPKFKFVDEDLVILRAPRKNDVYSLDLKNIIPSGGITCLVAKGKSLITPCGHVRKGKQHRASCKKIEERTGVDHGTEFKNNLNEFCAIERNMREYSIARTPQQNGVAERKNRTLIEAARTMLADSLLPIQFWAEAVNTACYVLNECW